MLPDAKTAQANGITMEYFEKGEGPVELFGEPIVSDEELAFHVDIYSRTGFTGGLNWYRALRGDSRPRAPTT